MDRALAIASYVNAFMKTMHDSSHTRVYYYTYYAQQDVNQVEPQDTFAKCGNNNKTINIERTSTFKNKKTPTPCMAAPGMP